MEFDNHWPIKKMFQAPRPSFVNVSTPGFDDGFSSVREEKCGYEEILPVDEAVEIRPTYEPAVEDTVKVTVEETSQGQNAAFLGGMYNFYYGFRAS